MDWIAAVWGMVKEAFAVGAVQALVSGLIASAGAGEFLAHMLPASREKWQAQREITLGALAVGLGFTYWQMPTPLGATLAFIAGSLGPALRWVVVQVVYWKFPKFEPKALQDNPAP